MAHGPFHLGPARLFQHAVATLVGLSHISIVRPTPNETSHKHQLPTTACIIWPVGRFKSLVLQYCNILQYEITSKQAYNNRCEDANRRSAKDWCYNKLEMCASRN